MDNADKETKPLEVMVTGGTEDERVHLAMAIGEHFVTNRKFTSAEFKFEDCPKEEVKAKLLRWGDVYSQMNDALHVKPIAIRALSDAHERNRINALTAHVLEVHESDCHSVADKARMITELLNQHK